MLAMWTPLAQHDTVDWHGAVRDYKKTNKAQSIWCAANCSQISCANSWSSTVFFLSLQNAWDIKTFFQENFSFYCRTRKFKTTYTMADFLSRSLQAILRDLFILLSDLISNFCEIRILNFFNIVLKGPIINVSFTYKNKEKVFCLPRNNFESTLDALKPMSERNLLNRFTSSHCNLFH